MTSSQKNVQVTKCKKNILNYLYKNENIFFSKRINRKNIPSGIFFVMMTAIIATTHHARISVGQCIPTATLASDIIIQDSRKKYHTYFIYVFCLLADR